MSEGDWVNKVCKGKIEYTLDNKTRVDCQMPNESQESQVFPPKRCLGGVYKTVVKSSFGLMM
jgi:hypothetical protein